MLQALTYGFDTNVLLCLNFSLHHGKIKYCLVVAIVNVFLGLKVSVHNGESQSTPPPPLSRGRGDIEIRDEPG